LAVIKIIFNADYLLNKGINLLSSKEDFTVDNDIIALLDVSKIPRMIDGNTIVIHNKLGIFFVKRTTKQLMNEFHKFNRFGFSLSKALTKYFNWKQNIPMVFGYSCYMPMTGGSRNCTDWIALHWIDSVDQYTNIAEFVTDKGLVIQMRFPRGNLRQRVHDVCYMSSHQVSVIDMVVSRANMKMIPPKYIGMLGQYQICNCLFHDDIPLSWDVTSDRLEGLRKYILNELTRGEIEPDALTEMYEQKIYRLKKLY